MMSRWRLQEQVLDGVMRADGKVEEDAVMTTGGGRTTQRVVVATEDDDDGWDLPPPPARRRRMWRCRCPLRPTTETTTMTRERDDATSGGGAIRDETGRWTTQGERVENDEGATRCRRTATEVRGEEAAYCNLYNC